ncbi:RsiV family protein [uncultured Duncaniella sp.]|uniref:RsiV family protein n=1 Tax=uncultured Duncaniella sp. TaxID=2768039 RepID=UPI0034C60508
MTYPGIPYISGNTLYFHYDPYEIGPYAMGSVDVAVYPYEIERFLQPSVIRLFDQGF